LLRRPETPGVERVRDAQRDPLLHHRRQSPPRPPCNLPVGQGAKQRDLPRRPGPGVGGGRQSQRLALAANRPAGPPPAAGRPLVGPPPPQPSFRPRPPPPLVAPDE